MGIITYHPHLLFKVGANIEITLRFQSALELVEIRRLDHLVVAAEGIMSLAERGLGLITLAVVKSTFLLESAA
ncbi:JAB domain-containing protein [Enterobacter sp.]|uniref:JAB domain-containing protein n=1 Tax=Enterobacter sp. TaxID=42895 RepID=UPI0039955ABD